MNFKNALLLLSILVFSSLGYTSLCQELNCTVTINAERIETSEKRIFKEMKQSFEDFFNTRNWTPDAISPKERIKCNILVTLNEMPSIGSFKATVQIRSARPVFNTTYESILFNFADRDWSFNYVESLPMDFDENNFTTNLTSILSYYAYIILGLDYDSFGELSGTYYFKKAQSVVANATQERHPGWGALESNRNRYALINDIMNEQFKTLRIGYYKYHRLGVDVFETKPEECRKQLLDVLESIQQLKKIKPTSIFIISFFDAKSEEFVNIFLEANQKQKQKAYNLLIALNPIREDIFKKIL